MLDGSECFNGYNDKCYRYNPGEQIEYVIDFAEEIPIGFSSDLDTWTVSSVMSDRTWYPACAANSVPEMIINGGYFSDATWTTDDGETFGSLPPMPQGMHAHCVVALDGDDLFVTGMSRNMVARWL